MNSCLVTRIKEMLMPLPSRGPRVPFVDPKGDEGALSGVSDEDMQTDAINVMNYKHT